MNHCTILCDVCMEPESSFSVGYRTVALAKKYAASEGMWITDHGDVCSRCRDKVKREKKKAAPEEVELLRDRAVAVVQKIWESLPRLSILWVGSVE